MTPGPRSPRRPGSIASRLPVLTLAVALPGTFDATAAPASKVPAGVAPGHEPLALAAAPVDVTVLAMIACAIVLAVAALALVRRRRRFEAEAAADASMTTGWPRDVLAQAPSGSRDPLVSLMTRPDPDGGSGRVPAGRSRRPGEEAAWVRRLERPGRHDGDRA